MQVFLKQIFSQAAPDAIPNLRAVLLYCGEESMFATFAVFVNLLVHICPRCCGYSLGLRWEHPGVGTLLGSRIRDYRLVGMAMGLCLREETACLPSRACVGEMLDR